MKPHFLFLLNVHHNLKENSFSKKILNTEEARLLTKTNLPKDEPTQKLLSLLESSKLWLKVEHRRGQLTKVLGRADLPFDEPTQKT